MLNEQKGNMYGFITHTWNTVKGACPHNCSYCYMKRFKNQKPVRFDKKELKTDLGKGNYIFVGSSCDMWADEIPREWIKDTLAHCRKDPENKYFFQSKNPQRFYGLLGFAPEKMVMCTTIETNRTYPQMGKTAPGIIRSMQLGLAGGRFDDEIHITVEPIMDFDLEEFAELLNKSGASQINIGADTGRNGLPEPSAEKVEKLISMLDPFVFRKDNLKRITG